MPSLITSPWRKPRNTAAHQKGGIHDDDTASELGFRGGTVAGAIHMEQFPPLLLEHFGDAWWQSGSLSLYFKSATIDQEPVRAFAELTEPSGDVQRARVWMEKEDGTVVLSGTAACGGTDAESEMRTRLARLRPPTELRVLSAMKVGDLSGSQPTNVSAQHVDAQLGVITEPLACYEVSAPNGRTLPATQVVRSIVPAEQVILAAAKQPFVGLYGGIEFQYINGPLLAETDYEVEGRIVGLSDSPQTEIVWWEFDLRANGLHVARVLKMDRLMKASSPLWPKEAAS